METGAATEFPRPGMRIHEAGTSDYPRELEDLPDAPARVWVRGVLPPAPRIAIVGSRAATPYGLAHAERMAHDLGRMGFAIVSGLARGIDAAAHRGGNAASAAGLAVLAGGVDRITPRHHEALGRAVLERGAILAEQPPGTAPQRAMFVQRNRLIAGMAAATIVVEAARRSGALSTAAAARRLGRPVFAVPGDVDRETSRGCNALLRNGALVCESAADVLAHVAPPVTRMSRVRCELGATPISLERLVSRTGLAERDVLALLMRMQWAGQARALPGARWVLA